MNHFVIPARERPWLPVVGHEGRFPIHRIYCVGRNFAEHAREMGASVDRGAPMLFCKPADAVLPGGGRQIYPSATGELHHEVELVVALGKDADGIITLDQANDCIFGHAVGLDLTRRDLQAIAKSKGQPWDLAKGFDRSAPTSAIVPCTKATPGRDAVLWLEVNGERRQSAPLSDMIFSVPEVLHALSQHFELRAGDLVFMGTPAGVGPLLPGDHYEAGIEDFAHLSGHITAAD